MAKKSNQQGSQIDPTENTPPPRVKMKFSEQKFYNDTNKPYFEANKIYELEGADWIQRWVKRGGQIVENNGYDAGRSDVATPVGVVDPVSPGQAVQDEKNAIGTSDIEPKTEETLSEAQPPTEVEAPAETEEDEDAKDSKQNKSRRRFG